MKSAKNISKTTLTFDKYFYLFWPLIFDIWEILVKFYNEFI